MIFCFGSNPHRATTGWWGKIQHHVLSHNNINPSVPVSTIPQTDLHTFPLKSQLREFVERQKHFPLSDHFINSCNLSSWLCISQFQLCPGPPGFCGVFAWAALSVPGVGYWQILCSSGSGICQPGGHPRAFHMHLVSYLNVTTVQTGELTGKTSSLPIKPELPSEIGSYWHQ